MGSDKMTGNEGINHDIETLINDLREMIEEARSTVAKKVNAGLTMLYWNIGKRINSETLLGKRADYGKKILATVSQQLTKAYEDFLFKLGSGFVFMARQQRIQISNENYYIDLPYYHRGLNHLVLCSSVTACDRIDNQIKTTEIQSILDKITHVRQRIYRDLFQQDWIKYVKRILQALCAKLVEMIWSLDNLNCDTSYVVVAKQSVTQLQEPYDLLKVEQLIPYLNCLQVVPDNLKSSLPSIEGIEAGLSGNFDDE